MHGDGRSQFLELFYKYFYFLFRFTVYTTNSNYFLLSFVRVVFFWVYFLFQKIKKEDCLSGMWGRPLDGDVGSFRCSVWSKEGSYNSEITIDWLFMKYNVIFLANWMSASYFVVVYSKAVHRLRHRGMKYLTLKMLEGNKPNKCHLTFCFSTTSLPLPRLLPRGLVNINYRLVNLFIFNLDWILVNLVFLMT